jgi:hypothetical protein
MTAILHKLKIALAVAATSLVATAAPSMAPDTRPFPRLAGMNIGAKHYDQPDYQAQLARYDWVILGFYPGWRGLTTPAIAAPDVVKAIKKHNPSILVGQYTNPMEAYFDPGNLANRDVYEKISGHGWWLTTPGGGKIQWTPEYKTWLVNISANTTADDNGDRYVEWLARRNWGRLFFANDTFDIWYTDNIEKGPKSFFADWGISLVDIRYKEKVSSEYRDGFFRYWRAARKFAPNMLYSGTVASQDLNYPEYRQQLHSAFLEALYGAEWSTYEKSGWQGMMRQYFSTRENLINPKLLGFNVWATTDDFSLMRFMFASCLLGDGYFIFSDKKNLYSSVPWFDEFDVKLGQPIDAASLKEWQPGLYRRRFERGVVFVNPGDRIASVKLDGKYRKVLGKQDPAFNNGAPVDILRLQPRSGVILLNAE